MQATSPEQAGVEASNKDPVSAWLYGDLIHDDAQARRAGQAFGLLERYWAGIPIVAQLADVMLDILGLIRYLRHEGILDLAQTAFDEQVVIGTLRYESIGTAFSAPVGAAPPRVGEPFDGAWKTWTPPATGA